MSGFMKTRNLYISDAEWDGMRKDARKRRVSLAQLVREVLDRFLGIPTTVAQQDRTRLYATNAARQKAWRDRVRARELKK